jgi:hypothetical protein
MLARRDYVQYSRQLSQAPTDHRLHNPRGMTFFPIHRFQSVSQSENKSQKPVVRFTAQKHAAKPPHPPHEQPQLTSKLPRKKRTSSKTTLKNTSKRARNRIHHHASFSAIFSPESPSPQSHSETRPQAES